MDMNGLPMYGNYLAGREMLTEEQRRTDQLTEAEKEHIILECKDARSRQEVEKIIEDKVPYTEMSTFLDEVKESIL